MIIKYQMENGLTVLLEPIPSSVSVAAGLWINTGSRSEREDQYGYAHFVEHMLFKGTEKYSAKELARIIDRVGGHHNAATNREYTCYYINVVYDYIELSLEILSDMYYNSLFMPEEVEKEKNVIIEEIKMYEDTPDELIHDLFIEKMFAGHPLSHSILGETEGIGATGRDDLLEFYDEHYTNNNAFIAIAGNFNTSEVQSLLSSYFGKKKGESKRDQKDCSPPVRVMRHHTERKLEQVHFCLGTEGIKRTDEKRWALYTLSTILGGSMSSRLFQNLRENEGICYSIYSFHSSFSDHGIFGIYCGTTPDKFRRAIDLILYECKDLLKNGITEEALADAKTFMKGNLALSFESSEVRMVQLAKNEIVHGRNYSFDDIISEIEKITLDDFYGIAHNLFHDKEMTLISIGNVKSKDIDTISLLI